MIIYYSELAKRARKIFGKGLQSKRLREIKKKTEQKKTQKNTTMAPSEQSQRGKFLVTGSSEQKAKSDKKNRAKKNKNNNYNILLRASKASEENFWLSYCRLQNQLKDG